VNGENFSAAKVEILREHMHAHTGKRICVQTLAQAAGMSVQDFNNAFTRAFDTAPANNPVEFGRCQSFRAKQELPHRTRSEL
jgi:transcriptional regulator GlxA family with amidase domain